MLKVTGLCWIHTQVRKKKDQPRGNKLHSNAARHHVLSHLLKSAGCGGHSCVCCQLNIAFPRVCMYVRACVLSHICFGWTLNSRHLFLNHTVTGHFWHVPYTNVLLSYLSRILTALPGFLVMSHLDGVSKITYEKLHFKNSVNTNFYQKARKVEW